MKAVEHLRILADYNAWMNARLLDSAERLSVAERRSDLGAFFGSIDATFNHLLIGDPRIREIAENVAIGDQIRINGVLASYSHSNGRFARGTSTSRTDTGNGACETIFVNDFEIVKKANPGWHKINLLAGWLAPISFLCMMLLVFKAPVRPND